VEVSDAGRARLKDDFGIECVPAEAALDGAEVAILAVPDTHIGKVANGILIS
jgi:D-apionate oxidoisomerase